VPGKTNDHFKEREKKKGDGQRGPTSRAESGLAKRKKPKRVREGSDSNKTTGQGQRRASPSGPRGERKKSANGK